jgi:fatty acid CoA ligase FadD9
LVAPRATVAGHTPALGPPAEAAWSSLHPPLEGCERVPLAEVAYDCDTRQSSATRTAMSGWMYATQPEDEPWWEIDLGAQVLVERVAVWLAPMAAGAEVEVVAHAIHTPALAPAAGCFTWHAAGEELPVASDGSAVVWIGVDAVARFVRVTLRAAAGAPASLLVRGASIQAASLFADTLPATYGRAFTLFADHPLFAARAAPGAGPFEVTHRYREVWTAARHLAAALAELEPAGPEGRVFLGLCTRNRPEWVIADLAATMLGFVVVPLSPDDADDRLAAILARCPLRALLVDGDGARFARLAERCPSLGLLISCEGDDGDPREGDPREGDAPDAPDAPGPGAARVRLADLLARGAGLAAPPLRARDGRDLCTLLFTSGSSGAPKGAMRSYATFHAMLRSYGVAQPAVHLSFQPLAHISERMYLPAVMLHGGLIGFPSGGAHLLSDLRALEPTLIGSVPRLFEVVHAAHRRRLAATRAATPDAPSGDVEARVLAETRQVFGSRLQGLGIGSAPVSAEVLDFLRRAFADLWVSEGYGSTECGSITTAGHVQPHAEVKLVPLPDHAAGGAERGEIWVRTPHVIDGYYGDPAATAACRDAEGFFATGDLGERSADGRVRVVGRVRNVLKLGHGEFVAVDGVEAALASCPLVDQIFVHPDAAHASLLAVVVPQAEALAQRLGVANASRAALATHPEAARVVLRALGEHGRRAGLTGPALPRAVLLDPEPMTVESGLLTASGKLARPAAVARYAARLAELDRATPAIATGDGLAAQLAAVVSGVVGRAVDPDEPLHEGLGADSLVAAEVLSAASAALGRDLPLGLWFAARTLADLAERLDGGGPVPAAPAEAQAEADLALDPGGDPEPAPPRLPFATILLTGATGLLGAHLLPALLARTAAHVVCLVRAPGDEAAAARVRATLAGYDLPLPDATRWSALAADLAAPDLGLSAAHRRALAAEADAVVHAAAEVSWLGTYEALRAPNVLGTAALLTLARTGHLKPFHFVSTISTAPATGDESSTLTLAEARAGGGYGLSKWVAEQLVRRAGARGHPVAVYRPAMITGHSQHGLGNPDDYVHRYLRACVAAGVHLDAAGERLDMTPVDFVADAIAALVAAHPCGGATHHLTNLDQSPTYPALGRALAAAGYPSAPAGYAAFRAAAVQPQASPLRALGAFFPEAGFAMHMGPWPAARTRAALATLGVVCPPVDEALVARYLAGLTRRGLIPEA